MAAKLQISLRNIEYNINKIKEKLYQNQELLIMVKADAYGAGLVKVTSFLESIGVNNFGVAYLKEAKKLRNSGIKGNIIVFSGLVPNEISDAVEIDAIYSVSSFEMLELLNLKAKEKNKKVKVEITLDTGMTRLGFDIKDVGELIKKLKEYENIEVDGVYSHLSSADSNHEFTLEQINKFDLAVEKIKQAGICLNNIHICNSAGILKYNNEKYNLVRLGISAYGYYPAETIKSEVNLKGTFRLTAPICNIRKVSVGRKVSYSGTYETTKDTKIAVLQIGYADGLTRTLSNRYSVLVNGKRANIIGNICMDTCMIDITDIDAEIGQEAIIFDFENNKLEEIANLTNTIVYEVITNIGKRVDREYISE